MTLWTVAKSIAYRRSETQGTDSIPLYIPTNNGCKFQPWCQSGANGLRPSTVRCSDKAVMGLAEIGVSQNGVVFQARVPGEMSLCSMVSERFQRLLVSRARDVIP